MPATTVTCPGCNRRKLQKDPKGRITAATVFTCTGCGTRYTIDELAAIAVERLEEMRKRLG